MKNTQNEKRIVYDIRGQICPSSLLVTLREVNRQKNALQTEGLKIIIQTDNRNATTTIPEAVSNMGYLTTVEKMEGGFYQIEIMAAR